MAHLGLEPCLRNGGEEPEVAVAIRLRSVTNRPSLKSWPRPVPQVLFFVVSALAVGQLLCIPLDTIRVQKTGVPG